MYTALIFSSLTPLSIQGSILVPDRYGCTIYGSIKPFSFGSAVALDTENAIKSQTQKPASPSVDKEGTYRTIAMAISAVSFLLTLLFPLFAGASFLQTVFAEMKPRLFFLHDASLPLLHAALHSDPNPAKGGGDITIVGGVALLSEAGPAGTIADIAEHPVHGEISTYTVREGDTLSGIAEMFDVSVNTILWANNLSSRTIRIGQELTILPVTGVRYTVKKGDTIASIAKTYKGDAEEIALFNDLQVGNKLAVGSVIIVPGGEVLPSLRTITSSSVKSTASLIDTKGYYIFPAPGAVRTQGLHPYNAVDLGAPIGTPLLAAADGRVIVARITGWNGGYAKYIVISHSNGTQTLYAHLSAVGVNVGDIVTQGQVIGATGNSGNSTGPHLHFEVRGGVNPFR